MSRISSKTLLLIFGLFVGLCIHSQPVSQTFSTAGTFTYTVPAGYGALVNIEAWGGGGGGQYHGGGGGAYAAVTSYNLSAGSYTVTVGAGGNGGTFLSNPTAGGASSFTSIVIAAGGGAGGGAFQPVGAGGAASASTGTTTFSGGNGGNGLVTGGGGGGSAWATSIGNNGGTGGGGTGEGNGGNGKAVSAGDPGNVPGGGGGGSGVANGGAGATGRVRVTVIQPLAVTFGFIDARIINNQLSVNWKTQNENNVDHFDIEVSKDGSRFEKMTTVMSKAPNGNSADVLTYDYSIPYGNVVSLLGLFLVGFVSLSTLKMKRMYKVLALLVLASAMMVTNYSCNKGDATASYEGKMYVRIAQVEKSGATSYSKVIQVIKEN